MSRSRKASESSQATSTKSKRVRNAEMEEEEMRQLEKIVLSRDTDFIQRLNRTEVGLEADLEADLEAFEEDSSEYESVEEGERDVEKDFWSKHGDKWTETDGVDARDSSLVDAKDSFVVDAKDSSLVETRATVTLEEIQKKVGERKAAWVDPSDAHEVCPKGKRLVDPSESYKSVQERRFYGHREPPRWASEAPRVKDKKGRKAPRVKDKKAPRVKGKKEAPTSEEEGSDSSDEEIGILQTAGDLVVRSQQILKGSLAFKKCLPINKGHQRNGVYNNVIFHPTQEVAITGTFKHIDVFRMEGSRSSKSTGADSLLKSYKFDHFDIERIRMTADSRELIVGSCHASGKFYSIDIESGATTIHPLTVDGDKLSLRRFVVSDDGQYIACRSNGGNCHLLTMDTKEVIHSFHVNGDCGPLAFTSNSEQLYMCSNDGQVYVWDIASRKCLHKFSDEGSFKTTSMTMSPDGRFLACGSESGVVNIYSMSSVVRSSEPKPLKSVMNLTTAVSGICFNPTTELVAISSWKKQNSVKLLHMGSFSVFANFPIPSIEYKNISDLAFSPHSGFFSFSGSSPYVNLFRLTHYDSY